MRLLIERSGKRYRLLRFETRPDGSLVLLADRAPKIKSGAHIFSDGSWERDTEKEGERVPSWKATYHTTGQINYARGAEFKNRCFAEPLTRITRPNFVTLISIPGLDRLDEFYFDSADKEQSAVLLVPEHLGRRLTFAIDVRPPGQQDENAPTAYVNYEIYSVAITFVEAPVEAPSVEHFIFASQIDNGSGKRALDPAEAELEFRRKVHGDGLIVLREGSGAYVLMAGGRMAFPPKLGVVFDRSDLEVEQISYEARTPVVHKVRFWIKENGQRNKVDDFRKHIKSASLESEL